MLGFIKNTRAKLIDFAANTKCKKEKVNKVIWPFCSIANFSLTIFTWFTYFIIVLLTIPFSIAYSPTESFQKLGRHNGKGYFFDSYSRYLNYHRASIGTTVAIAIIITAKVVLTFVALHPTGTIAGGEPPPASSCDEPLGVYINSPSSTQTIDEEDSFTLSGHFCATYDDDGGLCTVCTDAKDYLGQYRISGGSYAPITDSTPVKIVSGTYSGTANSEGDLDPSGCDCEAATATWSQTATANTGSEGKIYEVRFRIDNAPIYGLSYSGTKTINVKPAAPTSFSHSANATSSITWSWTDNSANETGYYIQDASHANQSADLGASATSWQETSLDTNAQYTRHSNVYADSGNNDSNSASVYTAIETPTGVSVNTTTDAAVTVSATGSLSNLTSGNSGLYFTETVTSINSDWTQTNSWQKTSLSPNTQYSFKVKARNGDSDETAETSVVNVRTLSPTPDVTSTRNTDTWYGGENFTFINDLGFGEEGVNYYRYVWDQSATHSFADSETQWNSSTLARQASDNGSWYLHVKSFNDNDVANGTESYGPYKFDNSTPTIFSNEPNLANTETVNEPPTVNVDFTKLAGDATSSLSYFEIRARTPRGLSQIMWTTVIENINAKTYTTNWTVPQDFFNSLRQGTNIIDVRVTDQAGNATTDETAFYVIKDTGTPVITNFDVETSANSATITWTTDEAATSQIEWGTTNFLGYLTTETNQYITGHSVELTGLDEDTTYYFKIHSTDRLNQEIISSLYSFTTSELPALIISDVQANSITETSAVITWTTDRAAASKVRYDIDTSFGNTVQTAEYVISHSLTVSDLTPNTKYYYEVISWDADGVYAYDSYATFTTEIETIPPEQFEETIPEQEITVNDNELPDNSITITEFKPLIRQRTITLEGKTTPLATVEVNLLTDSVLHTVTTDNQGYWSTTFKEIPLGKHKVVVTITKDNIIIETKIGAFIVISPAATILYPTNDLRVIDRKPIIKGLAKSGYKVKVYIDDIYNGYTMTTTHESGTGSFAYEPFLDLTYGQHTLHAVSEDAQGNNSDLSETVTFSTVYPFVTPTLYDPIINSATPPDVTITGLAKNGSTIYVYLNDQLHGAFAVTDHNSGTASFTYNISTDGDLAIGSHSIYLVACRNELLSWPTRTIRFIKPTSATIDPLDDFVYTVQANDSLWLIAQKYYGEGGRYSELITRNKINYPALINNPNIIRPGWLLYI